MKSLVDLAGTVFLLVTGFSQVARDDGCQQERAVASETDNPIIALFNIIYIMRISHITDTH